MTKFIAIASAKGGVGKTTTAINLGVALNNLGRDVIVFDGNLTTPNVGLRLGVSKVPISLHDIIGGKGSILNAIYRHVSGVKIIPGDISVEGLNRLDAKRFKKAFEKLKGASELVIMDSSAGLNKENLNMMALADEVLIVTTPDITAVTDALKTIKLAEDKNMTVIGVVLNRVRGDELELSSENVETMLDKPVIAEIPESEDIREAQAVKHPVVYTNLNSAASNGFKGLAARLIGENYSWNTEKEEDGWFSYFLGKLGLK